MRILILTSASLLLLGACAGSYRDSGKSSPFLGRANASNIAAHAQAGAQDHSPTDGVRAARAIDNYQRGTAAAPVAPATANISQESEERSERN